MPFIPHTETDIREMLAAIGVDTVEDLFDEIPADLRAGHLSAVPEGLSEMAVSRLMLERAARDGMPLSFIGAGAYEHHIPAAVWEITTRGEFYSAYTPYQAEASQGTLQVIYEFQSMMAALTGMAVSNASLYDGASALAEAMLMAVRGNRKSRSRRILVPASLSPIYRKVAHAITGNQGLVQSILPYTTGEGTVAPESLDAHAGEDIAALVIAQPNFFGALEDVDALTDWAHAQGALVIAVVNPVSLALLRPPGEWGETGADIVCGEGQPLGAPLSSGGPYFGFMCCTSALVRQLPGRVVGRTIDLDGNPGFTLTLQPREQHIRRSRATSNICTNQGLVVTAATIHMALLGPAGLERVAAACHANTRDLVRRLTAIDGVEQVFAGGYFHEAVVRLDRPVREVLERLAEHDIFGGYDLSDDYPDLGQALLVCATETKTEADLEAYASALNEIMTATADTRGHAPA